MSSQLSQLQQQHSELQVSASPSLCGTPCEPVSTLDMHVIRWYQPVEHLCQAGKLARLPACPCIFRCSSYIAIAMLLLASMIQQDMPVKPDQVSTSLGQTCIPSGKLLTDVQPPSSPRHWCYRQSSWRARLL